MRKVTMNEYIELIDELCAKCDSGELTEEGVNDILAEITISEWKSDPREPHDVPDDYIPPSSNCYDDSRDFNNKVRCKS